MLTTSSENKKGGVFTPPLGTIYESYFIIDPASVGLVFRFQLSVLAIYPTTFRFRTAFHIVDPDISASFLAPLQPTNTHTFTPLKLS